MTELPTETPEISPDPEPDPILVWNQQKFYLTANLALAAVSIALLKIEGPWYVDGIVAGFFFIGFCFSIASRRALSVRGVAGRWFLLAVGLFHLAACIVIVWLTFISPPEAVPTEDAASAPATYSTLDL